MTDALCRFGPFLVDRVGYRVLRDGEALALTPQLFDLLLHLSDRAGELVTKDALMEALWPNVHVTENALTQAVSELRQVLGDEVRTPQFIQTIARRGYRFIAPVERIEVSSGGGLALSASPASSPRAVAVLDFVNVTGEPDCAWLAAGIAETVTGDLRALGHFRVIERTRILEASRRTNGTLTAMANDLRAHLFVSGGFQRTNGHIRITARLVDVVAGEALADAKVDGPLSAIFALQDAIVDRFSRVLGLAPTPLGPRFPGRETSSLEAYRAWTTGWLKIESLDTRQLQRAIDDFSQAASLDRRFAPAYAGLATAELALYESTRFDIGAGDRLLGDALAHARRAIELDEGSAEAHATLAMILVSAWLTPEAAASARRAVALEPSHWRHLFRLCHATWGDARLDAATRTLALYPEFAFAHYQMAMVYVARGQLAQADTVLLQGVEIQDRQIRERKRFPALGLHWLRGLIRLAQDDMVTAVAEFDRELELADPHRVYGHEYVIDALQGRGFACARDGLHPDAVVAFERALSMYPKSVLSRLGLADALLAVGREADARQALVAVEQTVETLAPQRPVESALARAQLLSARGQREEAVHVLAGLLMEAPPGFAAWTVPIDPLFRPLQSLSTFATVLRRLAERAR